jgi:hypothetical protein
MNRLFSAKAFFVAAVALGAVGAASAAHARTDVVFSIGVPGYVQPAPVYVQPEPVYVRPAPVYVQPEPVYVRPYRVYEPVYEHRYWRHRAWEREHGRWADWDHDGVPNRYDRWPNNPYRR